MHKPSRRHYTRIKPPTIVELGRRPMRMEVDKSLMTVGIAMIIRWRYDPDDLGWAVVAASDRMLTNSDTEYEPPQMKVALIRPKVRIFTAGSAHIHSEALRATLKDVVAEQEDNIQKVAEIYASHVRAVRLRIAAQTYLAPLGLDEMTFLSMQKDMDPDLVKDLARKMSYTASDEIEAIVAGINPDGIPDIYHVDTNGIATCHSDVGFLAIGIGGAHARVQLMAAEYSQYTFFYYDALSTLYFAKKTAEAAPGVGKKRTDLFLITRQAAEQLNDDILSELERIYKETSEKRLMLAKDAIQQLHNFLKEKAHRDTDKKDEAQDSPEGSTTPNLPG